MSGPSDTESSISFVFLYVSQATGDVWARVPNSGAYDVERAAKAAKKAFPAWAALSYEARAEFMMKVKFLNIITIYNLTNVKVDRYMISALFCLSPWRG